ncbi:Uncharacterised protein [Acinetobacter baumannii]|nr:Uncharacterised protein [Acinetobacter baumannii]
MKFWEVRKLVVLPIALKMKMLGLHLVMWLFVLKTNSLWSRVIMPMRMTGLPQVTVRHGQMQHVRSLSCWGVQIEL